MTSENLGYVDVRWYDLGEQPSGIDESTVDRRDITITTGQELLNILRVEHQGDGVFRYFYEGTLADGTVRISFVAGRVADLAGNTNSLEIEEFTYDATPPRVTVDRLLTVDRQPPLSGTLDDPAATVQVTVDGNAYIAVNDGDRTWTLPDDTILPALADGVYEVVAVAVDTVGNAGEDTSSWELAIGAPPFQNPIEPLDVNDDGYISPIDALLVINYLLRHPGDPTPPPPSQPPPPYYDVSGDNYITPIDALRVINELQRGGGEGEADTAPTGVKVIAIDPVHAVDLVYRQAEEDGMNGINRMTLLGGGSEVRFTDRAGRAIRWPCSSAGGKRIRPRRRWRRDRRDSWLRRQRTRWLGRSSFGRHPPAARLLPSGVWYSCKSPLALASLAACSAIAASFTACDGVEILHGELAVGRSNTGRRPVPPGATGVARAQLRPVRAGSRPGLRPRLRERFRRPVLHHHARRGKREAHAVVFQRGRDGLDLAEHLEHRLHGRLAAHGADLVGIDRLRRRVAVPGGLAQIGDGRVVIADQPLSRAEAAQAVLTHVGHQLMQRTGGQQRKHSDAVVVQRQDQRRGQLLAGTVASTLAFAEHSRRVVVHHDHQFGVFRQDARQDGKQLFGHLVDDQPGSPACGSSAGRRDSSTAGPESTGR